jgi:hypothetical protein
VLVVILTVGYSYRLSKKLIWSGLAALIGIPW